MKLERWLDPISIEVREASSGRRELKFASCFFSPAKSSFTHPRKQRVLLSVLYSAVNLV